jgi:hypothetical protein
MFHVYIAAGISIAFQLAASLILHGRLIQKVEDQGKRQDGQESRLKELDTTVDQHHGEIGVVYGRLGLRR